MSAAVRARSPSGREAPGAREPSVARGVRLKWIRGALIGKGSFGSVYRGFIEGKVCLFPFSSSSSSCSSSSFLLSVFSINYELTNGVFVNFVRFCLKGQLNCGQGNHNVRRSASRRYKRPCLPEEAPAHSAGSFYARKSEPRECRALLGDWQVGRVRFFFFFFLFFVFSYFQTSCDFFDLFSQRKLYIFMEFMTGSLSGLLKEAGKLDEETTINFTRQITSGLAFLHSKGVIHCDIKAENILVDSQGSFKLADFGLSVLTDGDDRSKDNFFNAVKLGLRGTPTHFAPEVAEVPFLLLLCSFFPPLMIAFAWSPFRKRALDLRLTFSLSE